MTKLFQSCCINDLHLSLVANPIPHFYSEIYLIFYNVNLSNIKRMAAACASCWKIASQSEGGGTYRVGVEHLGRAAGVDVVEGQLEHERHLRLALHRLRGSAG